MIWILTAILVCIVWRWIERRAKRHAYEVGRQWGWLSVNDIRRLMNMNSDYKEQIGIITKNKELLKEEKEETTKRLEEYKSIANEKEKALLEKDSIIVNTQKFAFQVLTEAGRGR